MCRRKYCHIIAIDEPDKRSTVIRTTWQHRVAFPELCVFWRSVFNLKKKQTNKTKIRCRYSLDPLPYSSTRLVGAEMERKPQSSIRLSPQRSIVNIPPRSRPKRPKEKKKNNRSNLNYRRFSFRFTGKMNLCYRLSAVGAEMKRINDR